MPDEVVATLRDADTRARAIRHNFMRLRDHVILGTDAGAVGDFFGYADHLERAAGHDAGRGHNAATTPAAPAFGLDETGAVEAGRSADFVVLDANPLDDIMNTRRIAAVYLRGFEVDRGACVPAGACRRSPLLSTAPNEPEFLCRCYDKQLRFHTQMLTYVEHRVASFISRVVRANVLLQHTHACAARHRTPVAVVLQIHKGWRIRKPRGENLG